MDSLAKGTMILISSIVLTILLTHWTARASTEHDYSKKVIVKDTIVGKIQLHPHMEGYVSIIRYCHGKREYLIVITPKQNVAIELTPRKCEEGKKWKKNTNTKYKNYGKLEEEIDE